MNVTKMLQNELKLFHIIKELKGALLKKIWFFLTYLNFPSSLLQATF